MLITVVSGPYSSSYTPNANATASGGGGAAVSQGILGDNGWEVSWVSHAQRVNATDQFAQTLLETVLQGADWRIRYLVREFPTGNATGGNAMNAAYPFGKVAGATVLAPVLGIPGRVGSSVAGSLALTAIAGTPASTNPATLTAPFCLSADNANVSFMMTTKVRELPVEMLLLPFSTTISAVIYNLWFVTS